LAGTAGRDDSNLSHPKEREPLNPFGLMQVIGGVILSTGYLPQIAQILRTHSVADINLWYSIQIVAGVCCMEVYALHLFVATGEWFFLLTNSMSLVLSSTVLALRVKYGRRG
jgi:MtN3 and saliva related transmembrane protein